MNIRRFCEEWRFWIRPLLIVTYIIFAIIVVPLLIIDSVKDGFSDRDQLVLIGGLFVLSAVPVSLWHIIQHVVHFTKPILQKHIIRILWMVPIYALNAWMGLLFPKHSIYVDSLRECYEAYVIYNFMVYLLNYLNLGMDLEATMEYKPQVHHIFPLCCLRPWPMGRDFIHNCKHGILQYTVVRPITTFISVICELCGVYGEGKFVGYVAFPYIIIVNNISQFIAMYCLVLFYQANKEDLKPMKPIPKFLCIKAVVFFSFFQGVLLNILVYYGIITNIFGTSVGSDTNLAAMLQNFLICIEMFIAACAHTYSFPHFPFHINAPLYWSNPDHSWLRAFLSMIDMSDVQEDVTEHLGVVTSSISRHFQGRRTYQPLSQGSRRISVESDYLMSKRQDNVALKVAADIGATSSTSTPSTTGKNRKIINLYNSNYCNTAVNTNEHNINFNVTNKNKFNANAKNYGATDNIDNRPVMPICDHTSIDNSNTKKYSYSQNPHPSYGPYLHENPTTSKNISSKTTSATTSIEPHYEHYSAGINQQQPEEQNLYVPSSGATSGIIIQQKRDNAKTALKDDDDTACIFAPQYAVGMSGGARHAFLNEVDVDDDLETLLGGNINRK